VSQTIRIGTRGSKLALAQSRWVQGEIRRLHPQAAVELVVIKTTGDRFLDTPLSALGGKGVFVKEIEDALQDRRIDCAVHSMKDVPNHLADGLVIAAIPAREDARDMWITSTGQSWEELPPGARVGTSSLRRGALLRALRSDLSITPLRGNVDTRLGKVDAAEVDAIVLAAAGLNRLGIERRNGIFLETDEMLPAVGQGALAIETRNDDSQRLVAPLDDATTRFAVSAERAFLDRVGGSCRTPIAAYGERVGDQLRLRALIANPDGSSIVRGASTGHVDDAAAIGHALGEELLDRGGREILRELGEAVDGG